MNMFEVLRAIVGTPPTGYEYLEYIGALALSIYIIRSVIALFGLVMKLSKKKKKKKKKN